MTEIDEDRRKAESEQDHFGSRHDRAQHDKIRRECRAHPDEQRQRIGQKREECCDHQKKRRIMPAEERHVAAAERVAFGRVLQGGIVRCPGLAFEHQLAGSPDVGKIGADRLAHAVDEIVGKGNPDRRDGHRGDEQNERVNARPRGREPGTRFDGLPHEALAGPVCRQDRA
jgi:hypothetical protein